MVSSHHFALGLFLFSLLAVSLRPFLMTRWGAAQPDLRSVQIAKDPLAPHICVIIRTYWAHGPRGGHAKDPLDEMLSYFVHNDHKRLELLLLVQDGKPFHELPGIVSQLADPRVRIYAQNEGERYAARISSAGDDDGTWNPAYHDMLYALTDEAVRACSPDTRWLLITNGDNEYDAQLIPRLLQVPDDVDLVALDFYSRYQRVTAETCMRFAAVPGGPHCKENFLRFCNVDLAAAVYSWPRLMAEDRAFSDVASGGTGLNDGELCDLLKTSGWKVHRITDACLVAHSPNPQTCALEGGWWDDAAYLYAKSSGGECITEAKGREMLEANTDLEVVTVELSNDGVSFGVGELDGPLRIECVRHRFEPPFVNQWYPHECAAPMDGGRGYD
jgi:hypothetical protein